MEDFECVLKEMESMGERGGYSQGGSYGERGGGSMGYRDENERRREEYERECTVSAVVVDFVDGD